MVDEGEVKVGGLSRRGRAADAAVRALGSDRAEEGTGGSGGDGVD